MANKTTAVDPTKYPDELSDTELDELHDPDDNPDEADVDASKHNVNIATVICGIVCGVLLILIGVLMAAGTLGRLLSLLS